MSIVLSGQGNFTNWLDGSPLVDSNWYQQANGELHNITVYTINNDITFNISNENALNISAVDMKQPEYNLHKNCTAAFGNHYDSKYTWIIIPCSKKFTVSFFCQSKLLLPDLNFRSHLNPINASCDEGWLMLVDRPVCYLILTLNQNISFYEGEKECFSRNASIYKVTISAIVKIDDTWLKTWFGMQYPIVFKKTHTEKVHKF